MKRRTLRDPSRKVPWEDSICAVLQGFLLVNNSGFPVACLRRISNANPLEVTDPTRRDTDCIVVSPCRFSSVVGGQLVKSSYKT
jgi:hypothetical protein